MLFSSVRRARAALLPIALATVAVSGSGAFGAPPATALNCASASYAGTTVTSYGATFQINAERGEFIPDYNAACGANKAAVSYNEPIAGNLPPKAGSGRCVDLVVNHTPPTVTGGVAPYTSPYTYPSAAYCGSDDPLTSQQWATANSTGHVINQVPVAIGADAIIYNAGAATCAGLDLTGAQVSGIFAGTITNFSQLGCTGSQAITRVVRNAVSGTTCILKSYLQKQDPATWAVSNQNDGCGGTAWPAGTTIVQANGNGGLVSTVTATAGAISYPDLASDVSGTSLINPAARVKTRAEAAGGTTGENAYVGTSTTVGAANCTGTSPLPPHTASAGWDAVTISDGPTGYPICGFTYGFIFTNCTAELTAQGDANAAAECKVAVDVLSSAVSNAGQALADNHYAPLPAHAQAEAQAGLQTIV